MTTVISQADFIDTSGIAAVLKCEPVTVLRRAKAGRLPPPVFSGANATLWNRGLFDAWIRDGRPEDVPQWLETRSATTSP
ncbi:MAG: hypothetical protein Q8K78_10540 [Planctomycetaceae bacterium]|nr:hypothetical protein [Planctomycetaceae bacterium]